MSIDIAIKKIRTAAKMSQEQFASVFGVSRQSVQKWESGESVPEVGKIIKIAKYFDVSTDTLLFDSDTRITEELSSSKDIKPKYANISDWEMYSANLMTEYAQSIEEGLDVERYKDIFEAVSRLPKGEIKKRFGNIIFDIVLNADTAEGYKYTEPSELERIKCLRKGNVKKREKPEKSILEDKIYGAWLGRICGCLLGKTVEGIRTNELIPFLKETGNYPMHRYIMRSEVTDEMCERYKYRFAKRCYADTCNGMPVDDDTNYTVMAQLIVEKCGRNFTPYDVSRAWLKYQGKDAYCTAERVAYKNFVNGYEPPESAKYMNPYREWIGAQIRGDYFGYINPGDPEVAADMAFRDACISHVKNGIYGEMFVSAMIAGAAVTSDIEEIIEIGLGEIPHTSRLYESVVSVLNEYRSGVTVEECFRNIHEKWNEYTTHGWCHTISNAMIVTAALLYGGGDYGRSVCMAVETGFDTDCNGATVGSVLGMALGSACISDEWSRPINDTLYTSIFGVDKLSIKECARKTLAHVE
ncbi:MAG: ADP-ribosylglycohydrolase family protein [Clostridia bacterium]|nr:ADP-ribosylglycohydrolase family protein [Clostridia bacterium]